MCLFFVVKKVNLKGDYRMKKFTFTCPHCATRCEAEESWRGMLTECPECGQAIKIPLKSVVDYQALRDECQKKFLLKKLILCAVLFLIAGSLFGSWAYRKHAAEQRRIAARRRAAEQRIIEEKKRALLEAKKRAEAEFIKKEMTRADKCKVPREQIMILEQLLNTYSRHESAVLIRRKLEQLKESLIIKKQLEQAAIIVDLNAKISFLNNLIRRHPLHPLTPEAEKMLRDCREKLKKEEEKRQARKRKQLEWERKYEAERRRIRQRIAEAELEIQKKKMKEARERREETDRIRRENYRKVTARQQEARCRWCSGSGRSSSMSQYRDCSFCHGTGITHRHINCRDFIRQYWHLIDEQQKRKLWKSGNHHRRHR